MVILYCLNRKTIECFLHARVLQAFYTLPLNARDAMRVPTRLLAAVRNMPAHFMPKADVVDVWKFHIFHALLRLLCNDAEPWFDSLAALNIHNVCAFWAKTESLLKERPDILAEVDRNRFADADIYAIHGILEITLRLLESGHKDDYIMNCLCVEASRTRAARGSWAVARMACPTRERFMKITTPMAIIAARPSVIILDNGTVTILSNAS